MAFLIRGGAGSSGTSPVLDLYTFVDGILTDAFSVQIKIFDISSSDKRSLFLAGQRDDVQVFPATPGNYFILDVDHLVSDPVSPGHKLSTGHYYAPFAPDENAPTGDYAIEWSYRQIDGGPLLKFCEEFVVLEEGQIITGLSIIEKLKLFMQDTVNANELLSGELEYTDQQYSLALEMTVSKYNCTTPTSNYTVDNFPKNCMYILLLGAAAYLMRSTSIIQLRNQLTYTDGNIHVGITDKHRDYQQASQVYYQEWERLVREEKIFKNNEAAWGDSDSPYLSVGYSYYTTGSGDGWGGA